MNTNFIHLFTLDLKPPAVLPRLDTFSPNDGADQLKQRYRYSMLPEKEGVARDVA
jgi:hypothetical protein